VSLSSRLTGIFEELGFNRCAHFYRDWQLLLAVFAGIVVLFGLHLLLPAQAFGNTSLSYIIVFNVVLWYPVLEEILFRGLIQGRLLQQEWGQKFFLCCSHANWLTSALFAGMHFVYHPPLWALAVFFPSLLFGHFRDRYHSIYPAIALHIIFNLEYLAFMAWPI
jgi:uncharacterized protein